MKFFFDRNWSPHLAGAIRQLCSPLGHEVVHLDERFAKTCPDVDWMNALAAEGGWAIVTKDRMRKSAAEREALRQSGIVTFIFTKQWSDHRDWDQAWSLVRWWPSIMGTADHVRSGAFEVPFKFTGSGRLDQIKL